MKFTLNRNLTHASTLGHTVEFVKDEPTFVPPPLWNEVRKLGAEPEDEIVEDPVLAGSKMPEDQAERDRQIRDAIMALTLKNEREDFGAGGKPHLKPLSDYTGWSVSAKERDRVIARIANE